jgi:hypothetical protein
VDIQHFSLRFVTGTRTIAIIYKKSLASPTELKTDEKDWSIAHWLDMGENQD